MQAPADDHFVSDSEIDLVYKDKHLNMKIFDTFHPIDATSKPLNVSPCVPFRLRHLDYKL